MADPGVVGGAFTFATDVGGIWMRFFTWTANFRSRWLHRPYGDQGLFLQKTTFDRLSGFPEIPIMDDLEMVRNLARLGRIVIVPAPALTAGRRWRKLGVWNTMMRNKLCLVAHMIGVPPATIARWYNRDLGLN